MEKEFSELVKNRKKLPDKLRSGDRIEIANPISLFCGLIKVGYKGTVVRDPYRYGSDEMIDIKFDDLQAQGVCHLLNISGRYRRI